MSHICSSQLSPKYKINTVQYKLQHKERFPTLHSHLIVHFLNLQWSHTVQDYENMFVSWDSSLVQIVAFEGGESVDERENI